MCSLVYHPPIGSHISGVYPGLSRYRLELRQLCRVIPKRHSNAFKPASMPYHYDTAQFVLSLLATTECDTVGFRV